MSTSVRRPEIPRRRATHQRRTRAAQNGIARDRPGLMPSGKAGINRPGRPAAIETMPIAMAAESESMKAAPVAETGVPLARAVPAVDLGDQQPPPRRPLPGRICGPTAGEPAPGAPMKPHQSTSATAYATTTETKSPKMRSSAGGPFAVTRWERCRRRSRFTDLVKVPSAEGTTSWNSPR